MRNRKVLFIALVFLPLLPLANGENVRAQASTDSQSKMWRAQWITAPGVPERGEVVLHFRKIVELPQPAQHFMVQVSADNQFILYVNGQRAGAGPSRSDLAHWRYETYDLAPLLHPGRNLLGATVWNFGTHAAIAQMSDRTGFLLHGDGDAERDVDTNPSWEVEEEKGIATLRTKIHGYYAAEAGERIDGAKFDWAWNSDSRNSDSSKGPWMKAVSLGRGALRGERDAPNNWQLVPDPLPPMEMKLVSPGSVVRVSGIAMPSGFPENGFTVPAHTKASLLIDNSQLTTGYPALTASGGAGSTLRLTYAEALVDDRGEKGNRNQIEGKHITGIMDEFLPGGDVAREFMPLSWRTWRYLQLDVETTEQPLRIEGLRTWFTAYPFVERAYFRSDDASLTPIWQIGWRTARLDAHDTYMDTPYWERLQYIGDTRIQALISYAVAGDDRLARQAIQAFNDSRIPDGLTQSRYPSSLVQMIPTFSLLWVGMVHDFWLYRGDAEFVRSQLPGARAVLDWYLRRQRADGLLERLPWWPFVDWGKDFRSGMPPQDDNGGSAVITLQFVEALRYAAELEEAYGDPHTAENYRNAASRAAQAVWKLCWNQQYGLLADTPAQQHYSQHANILAVWLDVVPAAQQKDLLTKLLSQSDSGFTAAGPLPPMTLATYYFRFYLARALEHAGMGDSYLQLLGPWRQMVNLGLTTWAESPEPTRSDSHAWSAHPNYDLLAIVAGIRPRSAGFAAVTIAPHLGALKHVQAASPTPQGTVAVEYTRVGNGVEAEVSLPSGVSGELLWKGRSLALHAGKQKLTLP
ncbi:MAG TPA: alpha-L-rhamnosidase C-terminal domain-containing protein [Terriglobales bacterium]